jgi:hypothetical protein
VRRLISFCLVLCLILSLALGPACCAGLALAANIPREHDPWGHFEPGAWKRVRVVTEQLDDKGLVSVTDKTTTLLNVEADGVTLEDEVVHEVAATRYPREPETIKLGFHGALLAEGLKVSDAGEGQVVIEDRKIPCSIIQLEVAGPVSKSVTKVYYSPEVAPYVLRRESVTTDLEGNNSRSETITEVVALDMPCKVLAETKNAVYVKTVVNHPKGTTTTWSASSPEVPGGVIWSSTKELDKSGRMIRRSTLELVDYGLELEPERDKLFERQRRGLLRRRVPLLPST